MNSENREKIITPNFMALFGAVFFLFVALDYYIPILPFYVIDVGGGEAAVGLLMGLFTLCSIILRPFQGRALNRRGRKRLLVTGMVLYVAAGLGLLLLPSLPLLFLFRAVQGFGWGAFLLAFNTITLDLAPPGKRGQVVGLMGMAPPISLAVAPILGEYFRMTTGSNYFVLFLFASAAGLVALIFGSLVREPVMEKGVEVKVPLLSRKVLFPSVIIFCMTFNLGGILTFLPLLGVARDINAVGYFFTVFALTTVISRPVAGNLSDRFGRPGVFLPALVIASAAMVMIATASNAQQLILSAFILGLGFGAAHSSVMAMAADRLPVMERGIGMATFTAAFDLGIVAGSVTLGVLLGWLDFTALFILCAAVMIAPVLISTLKQKRENKANRASDEKLN
jgi:MFS family permease